MKKILLVLALVSSTAAMAHGYWRHDGHGGFNWVAPALVGGVIGYEIARPPVPATAPVIVEQPVIVQQPVITQGQVCSPWTQTQQPDGSIVTTRTCR
jgi:hypothetical protein